MIGKGNPVILNFWTAGTFSWAGIPVLQKFYDENQGKVQLLSVGLYLRSEEDEDARSFIGNMDITYPIGIAVDEERLICS